MGWGQATCPWLCGPPAFLRGRRDRALVSGRGVLAATLLVSPDCVWRLPAGGAAPPPASGQRGEPCLALLLGPVSSALPSLTGQGSPAPRWGPGSLCACRKKTHWSLSSGPAAGSVVAHGGPCSGHVCGGGCPAGRGVAVAWWPFVKERDRGRWHVCPVGPGAPSPGGRPQPTPLKCCSLGSGRHLSRTGFPPSSHAQRSPMGGHIRRLTPPNLVHQWNAPGGDLLASWKSPWVTASSTGP